MGCPKISVIVPVFNAESTIKRCVDSILAQTFTDFECLLINDGSKDRSGEICDEYAEKDSRVKVFHKENGGVSSARNVGLNNATGEWISFADSDDWLDKEWLSTFADLEPDSDMVVSGIRFISNERIYERGLDYKGDKSSAINYLAKHHILGYSVNKSFRRRIIEKQQLVFDERIKFKEDEDFVLRYLIWTRLSIVCVHEAYYNYDFPDLSSKYICADNFFVNLSLFSSIKSLNVDSQLYNEYLKGVINAFFASFPSSIRYLNERMERLVSLSNAANSDLGVCSLSFISKLLIIHPSFLSVCFFNFKAHMVQLINNSQNHRSI